jgi:hypothetical protein
VYSIMQSIMTCCGYIEYRRACICLMLHGNCSRDESRHTVLLPCRLLKEPRAAACISCYATWRQPHLQSSNIAVLVVLQLQCNILQDTVTQQRQL